MSAVTRNEVRLTGAAPIDDDKELRVTLWQGPGGVVARFTIVADEDDLLHDAEIDVPVAELMPLLIALTGSYERHGATAIGEEA